jgi:hypothetical protein
MAIKTIEVIIVDELIVLECKKRTSKLAAHIYDNAL